MAIVITLIVVGAVLIFLETVLPGLIAGILGVLCLAGAVVVGYVQFGAEGGTWVLIAVGLALFGGGIAYVKLFPTSVIAQRFISRGAIGLIGAERTGLVGREGTAHTILRPSGTALIGSERVDVVTEGPLVERGAAIKVVAVEGMRVVVRAI